MTPKVRSLEWKENGASSVWTGELTFNTFYVIYDESNGFRVYRGQFLSEAGETEVAYCATLEAAKAAAQTSWATPILSALEPTTDAGEVTDKHLYYGPLHRGGLCSRCGESFRHPNHYQNTEEYLGNQGAASTSDAAPRR
jgi:hypothetical protein